MLLKRWFDILVSLILLILASPIMLVIACLLWWEGGGIFFRQERVGYQGRIFRIIKFRTMTPSTGGREVTAATDTRITAIGRRLRKYKLDELPQLLNVLRGEMSLVGPRPEVPHYVAYYPEQMRDLLLSVPPGITDLASVTFYNEEKLLGAVQGDVEAYYIKEVLPLKLKLASEYVTRRCLLFDINLLLKTVMKLVRHCR